MDAGGASGHRGDRVVAVRGSALRGGVAGWRFGGPRVDHKTAVELGFDAGFGPGTKPSDVANYIYYRLLERMGRAPAPQKTAHGTQDATVPLTGEKLEETL